MITVFDTKLRFLEKKMIQKYLIEFFSKLNKTNEFIFYKRHSKNSVAF